MKAMRLLLCALPVALSGCSTLSSVNWSSAYPWNWFGSSTEVTEQGVGKLTAATPMNEEAISDALGSDYRLRSGMKTAGGSIVKYFEGLKDNRVVIVVDGESGIISQIEVMDSEIPAEDGTRIGTPFRDIYTKAYGNCQKGSGDNADAVECRAKGSQRISYLFSGSWNGPRTLMPPDDILRTWKVSKILWHR